MVLLQHLCFCSNSIQMSGGHPHLNLCPVFVISSGFIVCCLYEDRIGFYSFSQLVTHVF